MIRLPEGNDIISKITSLPLSVEVSLNGEIFIIDMLNRRKYKLYLLDHNQLQIQLIEQE